MNQQNACKRINKRHIIAIGLNGVPYNDYKGWNTIRGCDDRLRFTHVRKFRRVVRSFMSNGGRENSNRIVN